MELKLEKKLRYIFKWIIAFGVIKVAVFAIASLAIALAITFGGPSPIAASLSINDPFKNLDYSALPQVQRYKARDGALLAYRHYATTSATNQRRVVLIHGSSASSKSMHTLAQTLIAAGFTVDALDMRGHGDSGARGHISYIGQLEDDVVDFMRALPYGGTNTLLGFSAGAGFTLRFSASEQAALFDRYLLLSPFFIQARTNRPSSGWTSVGIPRIVAITILNGFGITRWNDLPVTQFALNDEAKKFLTPSYSFALATNFGAHREYPQDIVKASQNLKLIAGMDDELMFADRYANVFASAGKTIPIQLVANTGHMGMILNVPALQVVVAALGD